MTTVPQFLLKCLRFIFYATILLVSPCSYVLGEDAFIQTRSASLQAEPKLLAKSLKKFSYGERVQVVSVEQGWAKVFSAGREGFVHQSGLSPRKLVLTSNARTTNSLDDSDISLAGKGFSPEVEKQLAVSNRSLNFKSVDVMEKITVSSEQTKAFIKSGKLSQQEL